MLFAPFRNLLTTPLDLRDRSGHALMVRGIHCLDRINDDQVILLRLGSGKDVFQMICLIDIESVLWG